MNSLAIVAAGSIRALCYSVASSLTHRRTVGQDVLGQAPYSLICIHASIIAVVGGIIELAHATVVGIPCVIGILSIV
jgi:hypothetical protein